MFAVELDGGPFADDTTIRVRIQDTGQVYAYTSVLGAKTTVRVMQIVPEPSLHTPSYDDFIAAVKAGKSFDVLRDALFNCPDCQASGFVKVIDGGGRLGLRKLCPTCKGKKTIIRRVLCRITAN